jgi:maleylpyruvate isomerase
MMRLHDYWRSTAAYRVRIGLNLKAQTYEAASHDLRRGEQRASDYLAVNPQGLVPALEVNGAVLTQSLAILEYLDETIPSPPLLPSRPLARARVRAMAAIIACDIHPLNNLRVLSTLRGELALDEHQVSAWIGDWIAEGFDALEPMVRENGGRFAFGDQPGLADCCLVPQVYSAQRFRIDLTRYPSILAAAETARALPAFAAAHPDRQPGADPQ